MKKLYFKSGIFLLVKLSAEPNGNQETRYISVYDDSNEHAPRLMFSVMDGGFKKCKMILGDGITELDAYLILSAAEIIEDFNRIYNNLNQ